MSSLNYLRTIGQITGFCMTFIRHTLFQEIQTQTERIERQKCTMTTRSSCNCNSGVQVSHLHTDFKQTKYNLPYQQLHFWVLAPWSISDEDVPLCRRNRLIQHCLQGELQKLSTVCIIFYESELFGKVFLNSTRCILLQPLRQFKIESESSMQQNEYSLPSCHS